MSVALFAVEGPPVGPSRPTADGCGGVEVRPVGRYQRTAAGTLRFGFPGSGVKARFRGSSVAVVLKETPHGRDFHGRYAVIIDGHEIGSLAADADRDRYEIASGLPDTDHTVELVRRTEGFVSTGEFFRFDFGDGEMLALGCEPAPRRILFIGDSVTAGFGVRGTGPDCDFKPEFEDYLRSFAAQTARQLKAEAHAIAWSGHGILRNDTGAADDTIPELFERAVPMDRSSTWDHAAFAPDVIVVLAGANDLVSGTPDEDAFVDTYRRFLLRVRSVHPNVPIVLALSPMLNDVWPRERRQRSTLRAFTQRVAREAGAAFVEFDEQLPDDGFGCTWHPSAVTHKKMAAKLVGVLRRQLRW